jgi:MFS family permease
MLALAGVSTATQAIRPTASYRTLELGGTAAAVGAVAAAFALLSVFAAIPFGVAIDRMGARRFLVGGVSLLAISAFLCAAADSVLALGIAQGLVGLGQVAFVLAVQSIVANRPEKDRGFALITVFGGTGQLIGPLLAGTLVSAQLIGDAVPGTTFAFLVSGGLALIAVVLGAVGTRHLDMAEPSVDQLPMNALRGLARSYGLGHALLTSIVMSTSIEMMVTYLPVVGSARGISPAIVGAVLAVRGVAGLASRLVMTRMMARMGRIGLLIASLIVSGISMLGIATTSSVWLLFVLGIAVGFGLGVGAPLTMTLVASKAPRGTRAAAMAFRVTGDRVGLLILAVILGGLAAALGAGTVFVVVGGSLLGSAGWVRGAPEAFET